MVVQKSNIRHLHKTLDKRLRSYSGHIRPVNFKGQESVKETPHLFAGHGNVLLAGVGVVLVRVEHDDGVGQGVRRIRVSQAFLVAEHHKILEQCCGSVSFWCGSGSADPCL
jgi:hypothetical protein